MPSRFNTWGQDVSAAERVATLHALCWPAGAVGLKPYFYLVDGKPSAEVTVCDCLPHHHLHLADQNRWLVILHLPRAGRLADPLNITQVKDICRSYPHIKLVIAHVGRAYCPSVAEQGLAALRDCPNLCYDISANCNEDVFKLLIRSVGPQRILYGCRPPLVTLRLRRICEGNAYVNLVRKTRFADAQTRRDVEHENSFTFLLYKSLAAFLRAARSSGLHQSDLEDVFYRNALGLLEGPMWHKSSRRFATFGRMMPENRTHLAISVL